MKRRDLLKSVGAGVAGAAFSGGCARQPETGGEASPAGTPSYLEGFEELYATDPHAAAIEWFKAARFGLFMHYGL